MLLLYAAYGDVRTRRIPNWVVMAVGLSRNRVFCGIRLSRSRPPPLSGGIRSRVVALASFLYCGLAGRRRCKVFRGCGTVARAVANVGGSSHCRSGWRRIGCGMDGRELWDAEVGFDTFTGRSVPSILATTPSPERTRRTLPYGVALALGALGAGWMPGTWLFQ